MARIYKRNKVWYVDYAVGSKRVRMKIGTSKKIAGLALKDIEVKLATHQAGFPVEEVIGPRDKGIDEFLTQVQQLIPLKEVTQGLNGLNLAKSRDYISNQVSNILRHFGPPKRVGISIPNRCKRTS